MIPGSIRSNFLFFSLLTHSKVEILLAVLVNCGVTWRCVFYLFKFQQTELSIWVFHIENRTSVFFFCFFVLVEIVRVYWSWGFDDVIMLKMFYKKSMWKIIFKFLYNRENGNRLIESPWLKPVEALNQDFNDTHHSSSSLDRVSFLASIWASYMQGLWELLFQMFLTGIWGISSIIFVIFSLAFLEESLSYFLYSISIQINFFYQKK